MSAPVPSPPPEPQIDPEALVSARARAILADRIGDMPVRYGVHAGAEHMSAVARALLPSIRLQSSDNADVGLALAAGATRFAEPDVRERRFGVAAAHEGPQHDLAHHYVGAATTEKPKRHRDDAPDARSNAANAIDLLERARYRGPGGRTFHEYVMEAARIGALQVDHELLAWLADGKDGDGEDGKDGDEDEDGDAEMRRRIGHYVGWVSRTLEQGHKRSTARETALVSARDRAQNGWAPPGGAVHATDVAMHVMAEADPFDRAIERTRTYFRPLAAWADKGRGRQALADAHLERLWTRGRVLQGCARETAKRHCSARTLQLTRHVAPSLFAVSPELIPSVMRGLDGLRLMDARQSRFCVRLMRDIVEHPVHGATASSQVDVGFVPPEPDAAAFL